MSISPEEIELTAEQKSRLIDLAEQTGKSWAEVLAEAFSAFDRMSAPAMRPVTESFYDAAKRLGYIGCIDGGPPDLSTNPKYMEGFGTSDS